MYKAPCLQSGPPDGTHRGSRTLAALCTGTGSTPCASSRGHKSRHHIIPIRHKPAGHQGRSPRRQKGDCPAAGFFRALRDRGRRTALSFVSALSLSSSHVFPWSAVFLLLRTGNPGTWRIWPQKSRHVTLCRLAQSPPDRGPVPGTGGGQIGLPGRYPNAACARIRHKGACLFQDCRRVFWGLPAGFPGEDGGCRPRLGSVLAQSVQRGTSCLKKMPAKKACRSFLSTFSAKYPDKDCCTLRCSGKMQSSLPVCEGQHKEGGFCHCLCDKRMARGMKWAFAARSRTFHKKEQTFF